MEKPSGRIVCFDLLKFVSIVMICAYHFSLNGPVGYLPPLSIQNVYYQAAHAMAVSGAPLFAMVNGALMLCRPYDAPRLKTRLLTFIVQVFFWRALSALVIIPYRHFAPFATVRQFLAYLLFINRSDFSLNHFWFILALIGIYILLPFLKPQFNALRAAKSRKNQPVYWLCGFLLIFQFLPQSLILPGKIWPAAAGIPFERLADFLPFAHMTATLLFYFLLGGLMHSAAALLHGKIPAWGCALTYLAGLAGLVGRWVIYGHFEGVYFDTVVGGYNTLSGALMTASLFLLAGKLNGLLLRPSRFAHYCARFLAFAGGQTLAVYYLHPIAGYTVLASLYGRIPPRGPLLSVGVTVLVVILLSAVGFLFKKIPFVRRLFA